MEVIGLVILICFLVLIFGIIGKLLGLLWMIIGWLLEGVGNCLGCFVWVFLIIIVLIALAA